jgi:hypothetical protein
MLVCSLLVDVDLRKGRRAGCNTVPADSTVVDMTRSASVSQLGSEFDDFLFAPIGAERNGMLLSVVSALARSDVDPWQEAAKLARLPQKTATQRLAALIAALPDRPSPPLDSGTIAARLTSLLPHPATSNGASQGPFIGAVDEARFSAIRFMISCAILLALLMSVQSIIASGQRCRQPDDHRAGKATGEAMTDEKTPANPRDLPKQAKPQQVDQQPQQSQSDIKALPVPPSALGRRPLFRK